MTIFSALFSLLKVLENKWDSTNSGRLQKKSRREFPPCNDHQELACLEQRVIKSLSGSAGKVDWKVTIEITCRAWQKLLSLLLLLFF